VEIVNSVNLDQTGLNPKREIPAFAEAAPRRQAKLETISNNQISFEFARPVKYVSGPFPV